MQTPVRHDGAVHLMCTYHLKAVLNSMVQRVWEPETAHAICGALWTIDGFVCQAGNNMQHGGGMLSVYHTMRC